MCDLLSSTSCRARPCSAEDTSQWVESGPGGQFHGLCWADGWGARSVCALTQEASVYLLPYVWLCDGCWALRNELDTDRPLPPRASGLDKQEEMTESIKKPVSPAISVRLAPDFGFVKS